ncbi:hypothetical protein MMPV_001371 [Pyropia vietnamensis]
MATRPLATVASRCFRRLSATVTPPSGSPSAVPPAGSTPPSSAAASSPRSASGGGGGGGGSTTPSASTASPVGKPAVASVSSTVAAAAPSGGASGAPPSGAPGAAADAPLSPPDVHSTSLGLDPAIDPASADPLRYRKAAWKYGGALLLFLPAYTYLTQYAIPEAEARKAVRRANAKADEEKEAAKAKAAQGRVVPPVLPRSMRSSWAGESPVAARHGDVPGVVEGQVDGEAIMAATARQQAEAQQAWERQRQLQMVGGGEPPSAAAAAGPPLLPELGSAPLRGATDGSVHQMFPGVKEEPEGTVSAADELALREVELAVKLKKLRSLPPSADIETQRAALLSEVEAVTAEMRALGSPPPGAASSP